MIRPGMTTSSTAVSLEYPDNKFVNAFARGEHPALVPGAKLADVKLVKQQQDTLVFYVLEAYKVVGGQEKAA